jgi:hypothetical protein
MKINRILLKISHFFGLRLDEEHQDDITINIPTSYPEKGLYEIHDNKCKSKESKLIMEDIMSQIYDRFQKDPIRERRCRNVKQVWVTYYSNENEKGGGSIITNIPYVDGVLYNPFEKGVHESLERNKKIDQLLND